MTTAQNPADAAGTQQQLLDKQAPGDAGAALVNGAAASGDDSDGVDDGLVSLPAATALRTLGSQQVMVPTATFKELKTKAAARGREEGLVAGRQEAEAAIIEKLAAGGFKSLDEVLSLVQGFRVGGAGAAQPGAPAGGDQPATPAGTPAQPVGSAPATPPGVDWQRAVFEQRDKLAASDAERERLTAEVAAVRAEARVRELLVREGVLDLDYAVTLLARHAETLDDAKRAAFDVRAWAGGLRKTHGYLFGARAVGATTGPPNTGGAGAPDAGTAAGANGGVDVGAMTKAQFHSYLRSQGMTPPGNW